ncbi:minor tail protein [Gordonia phage Yakult]|nr:minor tail protein [Gordonia phage Yakult]
MSNWKVTLTPPSGEPMVVHPERLATHGVYLAEGQVKGDIVDAPVQTEWDSLAKQEGGTQRGVDWEYRDISLGFHVTDKKISAEEADSMLRMAFDYEVDEWDPSTQRQTRLDLEVIGGPFAGSLRSLDLLMHEQIGLEFDRDPFADQYSNPILELRAGQPMWYEDDPAKTISAVDIPANATGTWTGTIPVENRTDRAMRHSWVIAAGAGAQATLPDFSWVGKRGARVPAGPYATRTIKLPTILPQSGGIVATLERGKVMVQDKNGTNAMGRMPVPGQYFMHRIPPYTRRTMLPVKIENLPAGGGRIELRQPQLWSRPYGLEMW